MLGPTAVTCPATRLSPPTAGGSRCWRATRPPCGTGPAPRCHLCGPRPSAPTVPLGAARRCPRAARPPRCSPTRGMRSALSSGAVSTSASPPSTSPRGRGPTGPPCPRRASTLCRATARSSSRPRSTRRTVSSTGRAARGSQALTPYPMRPPTATSSPEARRATRTRGGSSGNAPSPTSRSCPRRARRAGRSGRAGSTGRHTSLVLQTCRASSRPSCGGR
mmetsp:Transcript_26114/g.83376  ORF Transcript_26114/g.83376 Transcript_26114/m.83376 type:complete len:220 (+) Transcript_26114:3105-3764(+)